MDNVPWTGIAMVAGATLALGALAALAAWLVPYLQSILP